MRTIEILHGPESYMLRTPPKPVPPTAIPEARVRFSDLYSQAHEKLLLRMEHVERMDAIRKDFNKRRVHPGQRPLTTSDLVNAALDFVFEHPLPFEQLCDAEQFPSLLRRAIYRSAISRWRQFNEVL